MRSCYRSFVALAGIALLATAGCSLTGAASTTGTVKVGTLCLESGDTVVPESCTVVAAMAKSIDAAGGAGGHQIEAIGCDVNRTDPTALPNCIRKLVYSDKVDVFVGNFQSAGLYQAIEPLKIASLASSYAIPQDFTSPMAFPIWGHSSTSLPVTVDALYNQGLRKPGTIAVNDAAGQASIAALAGYYKQHGLGLDVISASPAESDYTPFVSQAKANSDNPLVLLESAAQIATISRAAQGLGYHPTLIAPYTAYDENLIKEAGPALNGLVLGSGYKAWTATPEGAELRSVMNKYGPKNFNMNFAAVQSYVGMKILTQALAKVQKDVTPADISGQLGKGTYTDGFLPAPVSWADLTGNPPAMARVASTQVVVLKLENGQLREIATKDFGRG